MRHCFCIRCSTVFGFNQEFKKHRGMPHTKFCGFCTSSFQWLDELRSHQRERKHGFCKGCDGYFDSPNLWWMHIESSSHVFRLLCRCCGKGFSFQYELDKHLLRHIPRYICYCCQQYFKDKRAVNEHCCNCGRVLGAQSQIDRHCCVCGRLHKGQVAPDQHLQDKHCKPPGSRSKPTAAKANSVCHCGQELVDTATLAQQHIPLVQTRPNSPPAPTFERKVACQDCGRTFARKADLQQHRDHTRHQRIDDLTGATCKGCRKTFACSADLQNHQKSTGHEPVEDRTYGLIYTHQDTPALTSVACRECRKTFACKANLQQHQQSTKHRGVSDLIPVAWKVCRKAFTHKGDLQSHQEALEHKPLSNLTGLVDGTGERPLPIARSSSWSALTGDTSMPDAPRLPRSGSVLVTSDTTGPLENGILTPCITRSPSPGSSALSVD